MEKKPGEVERFLILSIFHENYHFSFFSGHTAMNESDTMADDASNCPKIPFIIYFMYVHVILQVVQSE